MFHIGFLLLSLILCRDSLVNVLRYAKKENKKNGTYNKDKYITMRVYGAILNMHKL